MTVMVALLRGVNVGGSSTVAMADVRRVAAGCGYGGVRTYLQSGNVVFTTATRSTAEVAEELRAALADGTAVRPDVVVRTQAEMGAVVAANPFLDRDAEPTQLHVVFLPDPAPASLEGVDLERFAPEEAAGVGRELYLHLPGGIGRSKLAAALTKRTGSAGTARNWRTVTKLVELADEVAAGP